MPSRVANCINLSQREAHTDLHAHSVCLSCCCCCLSLIESQLFVCACVCESVWRSLWIAYHTHTHTLPIKIHAACSTNVSLTLPRCKNCKNTQHFDAVQILRTFLSASNKIFIAVKATTQTTQQQQQAVQRQSEGRAKAKSKA